MIFRTDVFVARSEAKTLEVRMLKQMSQTSSNKDSLIIILTAGIANVISHAYFTNADTGQLISNLLLSDILYPNKAF